MGDFTYDEKTSMYFSRGYDVIQDVYYPKNTRRFDGYAIKLMYDVASETYILTIIDDSDEYIFLKFYDKDNKSQMNRDFYNITGVTAVN